MHNLFIKACDKKITSGIIAGAIVVSFAVYHLASALDQYAIHLESSSAQYLSIADSNQTGLDLSGNSTIELWFKLESQPATNEKIALVTKEAAQPNHGYVLDYADNGGTKYLGFIVSTDGSNDGGDVLTVNYTLTTDAWYHIAVVYNDDGDEGIATFYVNGVDQGSSSRNAGRNGIYNNNQPFEIGHSQTGVGGYGYADGSIDDVRVWNIARTASEIANNYQAELAGNEPGLVGYWKFNNDLNDSSGHGNTLTNHNGATFVSLNPVMLAVRKSQNQSVVASTVLQNDTELIVDLPTPNTTYVITGSIFATTTSPVPDMKIALTAPTGAVMDIGYISSSGPNHMSDLLQVSGQAGGTISMAANTPTIIHMEGTVRTGNSAGVLRLSWAQHTSNAAAVDVLRGSYLKADPI